MKKPGRYYYYLSLPVWKLRLREVTHHGHISSKVHNTYGSMSKLIYASVVLLLLKNLTKSLYRNVSYSITRGGGNNDHRGESRTNYFLFSLGQDGKRFFKVFISSVGLDPFL